MQHLNLLLFFLLSTIISYGQNSYDEYFTALGIELDTIASESYVNQLEINSSFLDNPDATISA